MLQNDPEAAQKIWRTILVKEGNPMDISDVLEQAARTARLVDALNSILRSPVKTLDYKDIADATALLNRWIRQNTLRVANEMLKTPK